MQLGCPPGARGGVFSITLLHCTWATLHFPFFSYYYSPWNPFSLPLLPTYCFSSKFQLQGLF